MEEETKPKDGERGHYPLDGILRHCGYAVRKGGGSRAVPPPQRDKGGKLVPLEKE